VAVLFKGKPGGRILNDLTANYDLPEWMRVQIQENGSYRSGDVVEALEWILPDASVTGESLVVLLDWFSGHLTEEVADIVRRKGHVLLFHGGGTTPFTQVNDTHLHALMQRLLVQYENQLAHSQRKKIHGGR
jgi:hypothetical protein